MNVQVLLLPSLPAPEPVTAGVCIVIDILRATTTLTTLLEYGVQEVSLAATPAAARAEKGRDPAAILLGEIGGVRPDDYDFGNSPCELPTTGFVGRRAICQTSNGTGAIRAVTGSVAVLAGCLRNASSVVAQGAALAREAAGPLTIVCAGGSGGRYVVLDDTLVAGQLVLLAQAWAATAGEAVLLDEAARSATLLHQATFNGVVRPTAAAWTAALLDTAAGQHLTELGLGADVPFCAHLDTTTLVAVARPVGDRVLLTALA